MTTAGPEVTLERLEPIRLLPVIEAQPYIRDLSPEIAKLDGTPVFLVHDGRTGTSHDFILEAVNAVHGDEWLRHTRLFRVLTQLACSNHTVRIWWAGDDSSAFLRVEQWQTLAQALDAIRKQASGFMGLRATLK